MRACGSPPLHERAHARFDESDLWEDVSHPSPRLHLLLACHALREMWDALTRSGHELDPGSDTKVVEIEDPPEVGITPHVADAMREEVIDP